jgi:hypothetical protein
MLRNSLDIAKKFLICNIAVEILRRCRVDFEYILKSHDSGHKVASKAILGLESIYSQIRTTCFLP